MCLFRPSKQSRRLSIVDYYIELFYIQGIQRQDVLCFSRSCYPVCYVKSYCRSMFPDFSPTRKVTMTIIMDFFYRLGYCLLYRRTVYTSWHSVCRVSRKPLGCRPHNDSYLQQYLQLQRSVNIVFFCISVSQNNITLLGLTSTKYRQLTL